MFIDGMILSGPLRDRLSPGPLGVRKYVPHKCFRGYTLFSTAFGSTEYLIRIANTRKSCQTAIYWSITMVTDSRN